MKTTSTLRPLVIVAGAALVVLVVFCVYVWLATLLAKQTVTEQHIRLDNLDKQAVEMTKAQKSAKEVASMVTQQKAGWGWSQQLPVSIKQLSSLEQTSGVTVDTLQPTTVVANGQLTRYPLRITLHPDLAGLTNFLQQVQQATPLCAVDQLAIEAGKTPTEHIQVNLTLSCYAIVEKAAATGGKP